MAGGRLKSFGPCVASRQGAGQTPNDKQDKQKANMYLANLSVLAYIPIKEFRHVGSQQATLSG
jgi:hypothetical protein